MNDSSHAATVRRLFEQVRDLPLGQQHRRLIELGADPLLIAEVDALLSVDAVTWAHRDQRPVDSSEQAAATELGEGDLLGAWRLLSELGIGGMGAVYLAERADGHFEQRVAIKLIRGIPDAETFVHFARERQILASLQHPSIARLLDGGATPGGQPFLVMEYVEGVPIDAYCRDRGLDLVARLRLFQQVCQAVQFAHRRLVVHCDLKPSNVLVRADGTPVLLDFGIARALDQKTAAHDEATANAWITPRYASPEQLRGDSVTTASDVFSLGLILFELLAGRRARLDAGDHTITLLGRAAVRPSELAAAMPWRKRLRGDLDAIVQRATASDPAQRYASADALAADLQRHLDHWPVAARSPALAYRLRCLIRRRWPVFTAAVAALVMAGMFTWRLAAERDRALIAERDATIQAATAGRVSDFLVSVFNVSNPKFNQQRTISAREVLDQGATRIEGELADAPQVKAKLLAVLGAAYRFIGEPARSIDLLDRAAQLYVSPQVNQPLAAADALSQLAVVYSNNKYPASEAERAAREALRLRELHAAPDSLPMADALNTLGVVLESEDRLDEAEALLRKGLAIRIEKLGAESLQVASSLHNLGLVADNRGDPVTAVGYFERSLEIKRKAVGEHNPEYQSSLDNYANALGRSGQRERALELLVQNLGLARDLYGEDSELVATAHNELGSTLHDLGRFGEAVVQYRAALAIWTKVQGEGSASDALPLNNLASAYEDMGDYAAAEPLFRQSLELRSKTQDAGSPMIVRGEYNLARLLTRAGQLVEARALIDRVLEAYRARFGEANANTAKAELLDVEWLLRARRFDDAALAHARVLGSPATFDPLMRARRAAQAARLAEVRGDKGGELKTSLEAWNAIREAWSAQHPLIAEYGLSYAVALKRNGHRDEADALVRSLSSQIGSSFAASAPVRVELAKWRF
jgi:serine/threonine-protein kinase